MRRSFKGSRMLRGIFLATASLTLVGGIAIAVAATPAAAVSSYKHTSVPTVKRACPVTTRPDEMACMVLIRTDVKQRTEAQMGPEQPSGYGYGPSSLQRAYDLPSSTAGSGKIVAVVDAYNDPNAVSDLATYRSAWGLPACNESTGAGCLTVVNQEGKTSPLPADSGDTGWATEESLDVDMVSAICPLCQIYLVEATTPHISDLGTGVDSAVSVLHAKYVSNSYGGRQRSTDPTYDKNYYQHAGVAVTVSAGDAGYGVSYPAASQYVTAVGGTSLTTASNARGWTETVWGGTGSGCATYEAKPSWQTNKGCKKRTDNDVAAVADPDTGVAIYDTYDQSGWLEVGGTSASSPIIASVFALAGTPKAGTYPSSYIYKKTSDLFDVTSGSNGSCAKAYLCNGEPGYDGPTGWGTPDGTAAFSK
ncbi:MAG: S53 family peptidase [Acidimicrobiales bacterium]